MFLFPVFILKAQTPQSTGSSRALIEYQCPKNGEKDVNEQTTLIIRPNALIMQGHQAKDFSFFVTGEVSGNHAGKVIISTDNKTIIFQPEKIFTLNETVHVSFAIEGVENFTPLEFSFQITSMDKETRSRALYQLYQREQAELESISNSSPEAPQGTPPFFDDTIAFTPAIVTIDTAKVHEADNIFFTATASTTTPFSFIAITSDTADKAPQNGNSLLFEKDIPSGCGNFRMHPDGTLTYFKQYLGLKGSPKGGIFNGVIMHLDDNLNVIDSFQCGNGFIADLHDFQLLRVSNFAILVAYGPRRVFMKQYFLDKQTHADTLLAQKTSLKQFYLDKQTSPDTLNAEKVTDTATVFDAVIQILDQAKNVIFQWNSKDHFDLTDATRDVNLIIKTEKDTLIDYMHINTAVSDTDNNIIASFRHCDEVAKISTFDSSFIWRWGGKHNQFVFTGPDPTDTLHFSHQHDPWRLPNGHITLFDNGNLHTKDTTVNGKDTIITSPSTRAVEYNLDVVNHIATVVWKYTNLPYCQAAGNVQRLANGNTMMGLGSVTQPSAVEVTPAGERVFQMSIQKGAFAYRTYRFSFNPPPKAVRQTGNANAFAISNIYPNPSHDKTTISFSVGEPGLLRIELVDLLGNVVHASTEKISEAGTYVTDLNVNDFTTGTYYCRLSQNGKQLVRMIIVQK